MNSLPQPQPAGTVATIATFLRLLNEAYPIDRTIDPNFKGHHGITLNEDGTINVGVWVWKQMQWRCYSMTLTADEDFHRSPDESVSDIQCVLKLELDKLIPPPLPAPANAVSLPGTQH